MKICKKSAVTLFLLLKELKVRYKEKQCLKLEMTFVFLPVKLWLKSFPLYYYINMFAK